MNLSELGIQLHMFASAAANIFYAARCAWPGNVGYSDQTHGIVFYRPSWKKRVASYSVAMYEQHPLPVRMAYVAVERSFEDVLVRMRVCGYTGESWEELTRENHHHYIAPIDQEGLWQADYGVVRRNDDYLF